MKNKTLLSGKHLLIFLLILTISTGSSGCQRSAKKHSCDFYDLFDTFSNFTCYGLDDRSFDRIKDGLYDLLLSFHQETDIYHSYPGITNLKDLNDSAGSSPLALSPRLIGFLSFCKDAHEISDGKVNVMIGALTGLWHEARETKTLPDESLLREAAAHTDISFLSIDPDASAAYITDPAASIDVGALAKGYAGRQAMEYLAEEGVENYILSLGGNICAHGKPLGTGRDAFVVGLQDPDGPDGTYNETVSLTDGCVVTSGDYQRYFEVNGIRYHHIIDPSTLYPAAYHHSVTVICDDSAMADLLSTTLFLMDETDGSTLAEQFNAKVIYK
ncbi:MAG: FAD:protein FMN transferase [Firmicutes bacterium]|nr:FAD:protein FMN transferase [Bacillota bacterium]